MTFSYISQQLVWATRTHWRSGWKVKCDSSVPAEAGTVICPLFPLLVTNCEELVKDNSVKTVSEQFHLHITVPKTPLKVLKRFLSFADFLFHHSAFLVFSFSVQFYEPNSHLTCKHAVPRTRFLLDCSSLLHCPSLFYNKYWGEWVISLDAYYADNCWKASTAVSLIIFTFQIISVAPALPVHQPFVVCVCMSSRYLAKREVEWL